MLGSGLSTAAVAAPGGATLRVGGASKAQAGLKGWGKH